MEEKEHEIRTRFNLSYEGLLENIQEEYDKIEDNRKNPQYKLRDILTAGFAMFSLKDPSLFSFERRFAIENNLKSIFKLAEIPSDSQMRTVLDEIEPDKLRKPFKTIFAEAQRGKVLESFVSINNSYLMSCDGTGIFSSHKVYGNCCMKKEGKEITYHHMMYAACIVHPDRKAVIPLMPEMIHNKDGATKNDCEFNAAKRFVKSFRREHPHLNITMLGDGLTSKGPYIRLLMDNKIHYLLIAKEGDHKFLFEQFAEKEKEGKTTQVIVHEKKKTLVLTYYNDLPLNKENQDVRVNFLKCEETDSKGKKTTFTWVTDHEITKENVYELEHAGRTRWKIENETFNTLKNQGYNLEHNYGHGNKNLCSVFAILMMLAFLVDQIQQACSQLFQAALVKKYVRREFWEEVRGLFKTFKFDSMKQIYEAIAFGYKAQIIIGNYNTS